MMKTKVTIILTNCTWNQRHAKKQQQIDRAKNKNSSNSKAPKTISWCKETRENETQDLVVNGCDFDGNRFRDGNGYILRELFR